MNSTIDFKSTAYNGFSLIYGLSALAILGMFLLQGSNWVALLALCAIINGSGAAGDLWMASIVLRYPRSAYVVDEKDGMRVLVRRGASPTTAP